jgi:tyrosinase
MKFSIIFTTVLVASASAVPNVKQMEVDKLADKGMAKLKAYIDKNGYPNPEKCTLENAAVRKEWLVSQQYLFIILSPLLTWPRSSLSKAERKDYIKAVKCLGKKPAKTPASIAAGAKNRYDDLVVTHIQQAFSIHNTASFLSWHRYFTWTFEQMLRNECGYKGYQPYYNWAHWAHDPKNGPFLDGSDTSMSGNGAYIPGRNYSCLPHEGLCQMRVEPGSGGGCVTSGPFKE